MKKITLFCFILACAFYVSGQEIILPESIVKVYQQRELTTQIRVYKQPENIPAALKIYDDLFSMNISKEVCALYYMNYADLLAQAGNLAQAVAYYDLAIKQYKTAEPKEFGYIYRKEYFVNDSVLYNKKLKEYVAFPIHNSRELMLIYEVKQLFANDQFVRNYVNDHPETKQMIHYVDFCTRFASG